MTRPRYRDFTTRDVVLAFGRQGIAVGTISRALAVPEPTVLTMCRNAIETGEMQVMPPLTPADTRSAHMAELIHLRERVGDLEDQIRAMRKDATSEANDLVSVAGLTVMEARVVAALVRHGRRTKQHLYQALYFDRPDSDTPGPKIIDVYVCKAREKLAQVGVEIDTIWGHGYDMKPEAAQTMRALAAKRDGRSKLREAA